MSLVVRIALLRPLARLGPHRWGPRLAEALVTRSQLVSGLPGSAARRRAAADEAVALCRRLVADRPDRHRTGLARALVARAGIVDGQPVPGAVDQLREAVGYVEDPPDRAALAVLAEARQLLAANLNARGEVREGLTLALRARATWDACAPLTDLERMRLAATLRVIGDCHEVLGRPEEALAVRRRAWELHRTLSSYRRLRFASVGVTAAADLAQSLTATGRHQEALDLIEVSRADLDVLCRVQPQRGRPLLARTLLVEAACRAELGEPDAALRAAAQAVDLQRELVATTPTGHRSALAAGLRTYGELQLWSRRREAGVEHLTESVEFARGASDVELARSLTALATARAEGQRWDTVEPLLEELVPVCRRWADELPEAFRPLQLCALLLVVAMTAFDPPAGNGPSGAPPRERVAGLDGETAGREAVALARKLADADPRHRASLGQALFGLDRAVSRTGATQEASELLRECVAVRRELYAEDPAAHRLDLVHTLCNLGNRLHALGRLDKARAAYEESVALVRAEDSDLPPEEAVTPLRNLTRTLAALGRSAEAERIAAEAETLAGT